MRFTRSDDGQVFQIFRKGRELRDPAIARVIGANPDPELLATPACLREGVSRGSKSSPRSGRCR